MTKRLLLSALALALVAVACGGGGGDTTEAGGDDAPAAEESTNTVEVTMQEYAYAVEGEAQEGPLTINFTNVGEEIHHAIIGKLDEGKTIEDVEKELQKDSQGPPPPWFDDGPLDETVVSPGQSSGVVLDAEAATYVLICFMPDPKGQPHVSHGMVQELVVAPAEDDIAAPEPDDEISITEDGVDSPPELTAGSSVIEVTNDAEAPGEVTIAQVAEGKELKDIDKWFGSGQKGPAPVTFFGGTHQFGPGESVTLVFDLEPGDYQFLTTFGGGADVRDIPTDFTVSE